MTLAISTVVLDWLQEVIDSYLKGEWTKGLLEQLSINVNSRPNYTLINGVIRYKGKLVIGDCEELKDRLVQTLPDHESLKFLL